MSLLRTIVPPTRTGFLIEITGDLMLGFDFLLRRFVPFADVHDMQAAGVEPTPRGRVQRTGNISRKQNTVFFMSRVGNGDSR